MNVRTGFFAISVSCLVGLAGTGITVAQELESEAAERCIPLRSITSTEVVDENKILFHMRGGDIFMNVLPHRCPAMRNDRALLYRTSMPQLCDLDFITVLENFGPGFTLGPSCNLGRFYPISKDDADALKKAPRP